MKRIILLVFSILFIAGCDGKDDALYAPWTNSASNIDTRSEAHNVDLIVNKQIKISPEETELCVTQTIYPHNQACTKEESNL